MFAIFLASIAVALAAMLMITLNPRHRRCGPAWLIAAAAAAVAAITAGDLLATVVNALAAGVSVAGYVTWRAIQDRQKAARPDGWLP